MSHPTNAVLAFRGLQALVADRHQTSRTWLREQLSVVGIQSVVTASSAADISRQLKERRFDLVLCDHQLDHKINGEILLEELRYSKQLPFRTAFIIVSGERQYSHVVSAAEFAPDDYLIKPYTPDDLSLRLQRVLAKKFALRDVYTAIEANKPAEAIIACDQAVKVSPNYTLDALRIKAELLVSEERPQEAMVIYQQIADQNVVPWARMGYALTLFRQGRLNEASAVAEALAEDCPQFVSVFDLLADICTEQGNHEGAMRYLERAVAISSGNVNRLRKMTAIADDIGDKPKAATLLRSIIDKTKDSRLKKSDEYLQLTKNLLSSNNVLEAESFAHELHTRGDKVPEFKASGALVDAMVHRASGRAALAQVSMDKALSLFEQSEDSVHAFPAELTIELARECKEQGMPERARQLIGAAESKLAALGQEAGATLRSGGALVLKNLAHLKDEIAPSGTLENRPQSLVSPASPPAAPSVVVPPAVLELVAPAPAPPASVPMDKPAAPPVKHKQEVSAKEMESKLQDTLTMIERIKLHEDPVAIEECRQALATIFDLMPFDRRVVQAHVRFNTIVEKLGLEGHRSGQKVV